MTSHVRNLRGVRKVLQERLFTESQIAKVIPNLQSEYLQHPKYLAEIIDKWNSLMNGHAFDEQKHQNHLPRLAKPPPSSSLMDGVNMNTILADVEPDLLLLEPEKLQLRHDMILDSGMVFNAAESWTLLFNAPRGFYLQDWSELQTKLTYIETNVLDLLYDKKELKRAKHHPIIRSASVVESEFDHIRTRYLFAHRCGYKSLSHLYPVQTALQRPMLSDLILSDTLTYLKKFTPFCSLEEYESFAYLIKKHDFDEDDAEVFEKLAELNTIRH